MKNLITSVACLLFAMQVYSQEVLGSVNHKISGKAATGEWVDYSLDSENDQISFSFQTKKTNRVAKFEHYKFGTDLSFLGMEEEEMKLEKMKTRFRLFGPKPDAPLLRVKKNWMTGQMIMETGHISYGYAGRALITNFVVDQKIKPKGGDGEKLLLVHARTESQFHFTQGGRKFFGGSKAQKIGSTTGSGAGIAYNEGDVCAIVYKKSEPKFQNYAFVVYDAKSFTRKLTKDIVLPYAMRACNVRDMPNGDMALIFAPVQSVDLAKTKKDKALNLCDKSMYKYMRVNMQGEVLADVDFELEKNKVGTPYTFSIIPDSDPEVLNTYIVGYGNPDFLGMGGLQNATATWAATNGDNIPRATNFTAGKVSTVVIAKINNQKLDYFKKISPDQFFKNTISNGAKTPSGKDAGKFFLSNLYIKDATTIDGKDFLIGNTGATGLQFVTQINQGGTLEQVYLNAPVKGVYFIDAVLVKNSQGIPTLIYTYQPQGKSDFENREKDFERTMKIVQINPSNGSIGTPTDILPKKHFIDSVDPFRYLENNELLVLGHSSRKDITLVKVKL